jgi:hypothetical protein
MRLTIGKRFTIKEFGLVEQNRQLIFREGRAVGHISWLYDRNEYYLWLQNYAGYKSDKFVLSFEKKEVCMARAKEILKSWDATGKRATWLA